MQNMLEASLKLAKQIEGVLAKEFNLPNIKVKINKTIDFSFGDLTTNVPLMLSKRLDMNPMQIAEDIVEKMAKSPDYEVSVAKPGYINFTFSAKYLASSLQKILRDEKFGRTKVDLGFKPTKVVVEFSSVNIAKPFGIGHLRSTIIGDVISRLLTFNGIRVVRDNHLGDWGTQFGKLIYAIKEWSSMSQITKSKNPIRELFDLYVKFHHEAERNPDLEERGRAWFKKLEEGGVEARKIWKKCVELSLKEFNALYKELGIEFDTMLGESFFEKKMPAVIKELESKNLLKESEGARLVFFADKNMLPLMIIKKDGTSLYATRDLATDKYRFTNYGKNILIINEVGAEQSLYFKQLFMTEVMLGWCRPEQRVHLKHGLYRFRDRKMSTRRGDIIWLRDLIDSAIRKASTFNEVAARDVAIAAIKWNDLKTEIHKDVVFDEDEMLNLRGNTGPYVQYTFARASSVLVKSRKKPRVDGADKNLAKGQELIRTMLQFPGVIKTATENMQPHHLCHYLYNFCSQYNNYYDKNRIIGTENEVSGLLLTQATANIIKTGLSLLGIKALTKL